MKVYIAKQDSVVIAVAKNVKDATDQAAEKGIEVDPHEWIIFCDAKSLTNKRIQVI